MADGVGGSGGAGGAGGSGGSDDADGGERRGSARPSRFALVKRSVWQLVQTGLGRPPEAGNYSAENAPRFAGGEHADHEEVVARGPALHLVSFNIDHGLEVDRAIALLEREPTLRLPDVLLLQEMEEEGSARMAAALGMAYVYYPVGRHPFTGRHFGNAVLVRGRVVRDVRHALPHVGRVRGTARIAVAATAEIRGRLVTAFSLHLATLLDASLGVQRDQLVAVLDAAEQVEGPVVIGGDLNRRALGALVERRGFRWLTRDVGGTLGPFAVDHLFVRGDAPAYRASAGVAPDAGGASDHRPVWSIISLPS